MRYHEETIRMRLLGSPGPSVPTIGRAARQYDNSPCYVGRIEGTTGTVCRPN